MPEESQSTPAVAMNPLRPVYGNAAWLLCGTTLLGSCLALTWLSRRFVYGSDMLGRPIIPFVLLMMFAALVYFASVYLARHTPSTRRLAYWVFAVGAGMRLLVTPSLPILEDDYYRYLWDGAVTAEGHTPYGVIPKEVQAETKGVSPELLRLGESSGIVLDRVNHPQLGTVYPPVTQAVFALAHWLSPWRLSGLRVLYYALDCVAFALLIALLRQLRYSPLCALIYWWNPLAIKEIYNSVHMDIILVPLLLGALLLVLRGRTVGSMVPLSIAVATKLWPVLLLPPLLLADARRPRRILAGTAFFGALSLFLLAPLVATLAIGHDSGFVAYGTRWEMNDALFMIFPWGLERFADLFDWELGAHSAHRGSRAIVAGIIISVVSWSTWKTFRMAQGRDTSGGALSTGESRSLCLRLMWIVAALFLLSPTQFPWYYLWLLPLLPLAPSRALLALTFVLPVYYLRFYYDALGDVDFFHYRVVWIEYAPVWALLLFGAWRHRMGQREGPS